MHTALVTLTLGRPYETAWKEVCAPTWHAYAARHGYDVIAINRPLDHSMRAAMRPAYWQKLLILRPDIVNNYDRIVWIDADIVINVQAPPVTDGVPVPLIGVTDESAFPSREEYVNIQARAAENFRRIGRQVAGFEQWVERIGAENLPVFNSGVMVLSPQHRELLEHVYWTREHDGPWAEQDALSTAIERRGLAHWIDPRFNALVAYLLGAEHRRDPLDTEVKLVDAIRRWLSQFYFLHFAACQHMLGTALKALG